MNRGFAKAQLKEYTEAIADYDKAIELDFSKICWSETLAFKGRELVNLEFKEKK